MAPLAQLLNIFASAATPTCWQNTTCTGPVEPAFPGAWQANILAPAARVVEPVRTINVDGTPATSSWGGASFPLGNETVVVDFGKEVAGTVVVEYTATENGTLGLAFAEARDFVGRHSDSSNGRFEAPEDALAADVRVNSWATTWEMDAKDLRGGFRYLTLFMKQGKGVSVSAARVNLAIQPTWSNPQAYQGYFDSSDGDLNRIWYSGAYTVQTNCIPANTGRLKSAFPTSWSNTATAGVGKSILVNGAKRDRTVSAAGLAVAVKSTLLSTGDVESVKNALQTLYDNQRDDGAFPSSGPPTLSFDSDTSHLWTIVSTYDFIRYTDDANFLKANWPHIERGIKNIAGKVSRAGLLSSTAGMSWSGQDQPGETPYSSTLLYHALESASKIAALVPTSGTLKDDWSRLAATIRQGVNGTFWDATTKMLHDKTVPKPIFPQDANSIAVISGLTDGPQSNEISKGLTRTWGVNGSEPPELPGNISPFISGFELQAHFGISETFRALDLMRRTWFRYLINAHGTESTIPEGLKTDDTFGYREQQGYHGDASYVSHAHSWSTAPTSVLTNYIAGLDVVERAGQIWSFRPQFGKLDWAEAGFMTPRGRFRSRWEKKEGGYDVKIETPLFTNGELLLPNLKSDESPVILVNGTNVPSPKPVTGGTQFSLPGGYWALTVRPPPKPEEKKPPAKRSMAMGW